MRLCSGVAGREGRRQRSKLVSMQDEHKDTFMKARGRACVCAAAWQMGGRAH
jgi:hypothetical protein